MALIILVNITARLGLVEICSQSFIYYALHLKQESIEELLKSTINGCNKILKRNEDLRAGLLRNMKNYFSEFQLSLEGDYPVGGP